jgi:formate C-acetyltransferase
VTAAESGTLTDFANINLAGLLRDGSDGSNELTHLLLEIIDEMHLLQPSSNMQISRKTPDNVLKHALKVIRKGYGFPSLFNADSVVEEQLRQGKTLEDAREGGCSGCVEVGAFGKEAYILTGYFNLVKMLELALHRGLDPRTGKQIGARTPDPATFTSYDDLFAALKTQVCHVLDIKIRGNQLIERLYATRMPHTFLSVITDNCIARGKDYNAGGARYNNTFIQAGGIGSISDSLAALKEVVFDKNELTLPSFIHILDSDFEGMETLRQRLVNKTHKYGNDDDYADGEMTRTFRMLFEAIDGRPNTKGGAYRVEMLPTTCHVYFGEVCLASADGRRKGLPLSEGISPVQGADRQGPTAVLKSAAKMDHIKTGGTLLNMKFSPSLLEGEAGIDNLHSLVRSYFKLDGHHMQFNVVNAAKLREAQAQPEQYRDLIVRVAGYSDYFCDLSPALQEEIIQRTEHAHF